MDIPNRLLHQRAYKVLYFGNLNHSLYRCRDRCNCDHYLPYKLGASASAIHGSNWNYQCVQRSLIFWASLKSHSLEKKWVHSLFHSHFQNLSALLIITLLKRVHSFFNHFFFQISNDFMSFECWNQNLSFEGQHFYSKQSSMLAVIFLRIPKSAILCIWVFEELKA